MRHVDGTRFGTDYFGQDVLSRFLYGGRSILVLAVLATAIALVAGTLIGLVAAYDRGRLDDLLMRVMDVNLAFPQLLLALVALTTIGPKCVADRARRRHHHHAARSRASPAARRCRWSSATSSAPRRRSASRAGGSCSVELLPNVSGPLLVEANLRLTYSIGTIASLGFLGFATPVNAADWGLMINENRGALSASPWGTVLPAAAIAVLTVGDRPHRRRPRARRRRHRPSEGRPVTEPAAP